MRLQICIALLFVCFVTIPSVQSQQKKFKVQEYNEQDRKETKVRYAGKRDLERNADKPKKSKYKVRNEEDDVELPQFTKKVKRVSEEKPKRKIMKKESTEDDVPARGRKSVVKVKNEKNAKIVKKKYQVKKLQESDEDADSTNEDNDSEVCMKKGRNCNSPEDEDNTEEDDYTNEDNTEEEEEDVPVKKRATYVKKFAHEKKKQKEDKEIGSILKMHKKSGADLVKDKKGSRFRIDDDDSSEEIGIPKRHRLLHDDDEE